MKGKTFAITLIMLSYILAYSSVYTEIISPINNSGFYQLFVYFTIYLFVNHLVLSRITKIIRKKTTNRMEKKWFSSLFFSTSVGFISILVLNFWTINRINVLLESSPIQSIEFIFPFNSNWIIVTFTLMLLLTILFNVSPIFEKRLVKTKSNFAILSHTLLTYLFFAVITYLGHWVSLILRLWWL